MTTKHFDLVILGSGSTAFAAALRAREQGKTAVMTEERTVGGTCVNRGCLPSKNLIEAAQLVHDAQHPRYPGLTPVELPFDFAQLVAQKDEVIAGYRKKKYASLVDGAAIQIETGHAAFVDPHTVAVGDHHLVGSQVLIATGSRPVVPAIEGLKQVPFLTSDLLTSEEPSELKTLPRSMLIVGGGYIALELGQLFRRFGVDVIIIERGEQMLAHGYEPEIGIEIRRLLEAEGIRIITGASVEQVRTAANGIVARVVHGQGQEEVHAERLLVATGRRPNTDAIGIERTGVSLDDNGQVVVDEFLRTSVPHIWAAGDVIGTRLKSQMATPVGSQDGGIASQNAFAATPQRRVDHRVVPRAIFTDPPIGVVGLTEAEAIAAGHPCWCSVVPMSLVPRAGAIRDTRGFIKMVADAKTNEVLGVTMVGHAASEVIHEAAMGLRFKATLRDFIDLLHVYPTMAEALKIVAISRYKDPAKLSCCAD
jgi:mercuric reductase